MIYARPNFTWKELECRCGCGARHISIAALDKLQLMRELWGAPLQINCAARCPTHNARVGGAPLSRHRSTESVAACAFDIHIGDYDKAALIALAERVGFGGIGVNYQTFLHVDDRGYRARW